MSAVIITYLPSGGKSFHWIPLRFPPYLESPPSLSLYRLTPHAFRAPYKAQSLPRSSEEDDANKIRIKGRR